MQLVERDSSFMHYLDRTHHQIGRLLQILLVTQGNNDETYDWSSTHWRTACQLSPSRPNAMSGARKGLESAGTVFSFRVQWSRTVRAYLILRRDL